MKGKYAAKAANRMAQLDSEIITDLRAEVADLRGRLEAAESAAHAARRDIESEGRRVAAQIAGSEISALRAELLAAQQARSDDRKDFGRRVFEVLRRGGLPSADAAADIASIFGVSADLGSLVGPDLVRRHRRATAKTARIRSDFDKTPSWLKAPAPDGHRRDS